MVYLALQSLGVSAVTGMGSNNAQSELSLECA